jgi:copper homeostasis protein
MHRLLLEVIVQSVADAHEAAKGGADRLEVVRAISQDGLTPPIELVRAIAAETPLPLRVMVRENAGYDTNEQELATLTRAASELAAAGVNGLVVGFARAGQVALDALRSVLKAAPGVPVTFHRAFDALQDPLRGIDELAGFGSIDRILTSGGDGLAAMRCERLQAYAARALRRAQGGTLRRAQGSAGLQIIAGSGVDEETLSFFARNGCVREVHVGRAARLGGDREGPVSAARVQRLRELADS